MGVDFEQTDERVHVRVRSKRARGTRGEDEVVVEATYADVATAEAESARLADLVRERLADARQAGDSPADESARSSAATAEASEATGGASEATGDASEAADPTHDDTTGGANNVPAVNDDEPTANESISKVYFGSESRLSGWIPVPRQVVMAEIGPLVSRNRVSDDEPHIKLNFTNDVPLSGWKTVDRAVVRDEIEPIVTATRRDDSAVSPEPTESSEPTTPESGGSTGPGEPTTPEPSDRTAPEQTEPTDTKPDNSEQTEPTDTKPDDSTQRLACPATGCAYEGTVRQVVGHLLSRDDPSHRELPAVECPMDGCSYTGPLDSVSGHFHANDRTHDVTRLAETIAAHS